MNRAASADKPEVASRVCVVTVSFHSEKILSEMLATLPFGVELVVVDNAGETTAAMQALIDEHKFIYVPLSSNKGFGTACNDGAKRSRREFLFFLNPDARLCNSSLDALIKAMDERPDASAANPCIQSNRGRIEYKYRSILLPRDQWRSRTPPCTVCEMPVLTGSALLVRRDAFEQLGGFDEAIFLYHEDDDLSIRLRHQAGPLLYVPQALVNHQAGHSSGRSASIARLKAFYKAQSRVYAMQKHGVPGARLKSVFSAVQEILNPINLFSQRKRQQSIGFMMGILKEMGASKK